MLNIVSTLYPKALSDSCAYPSTGLWLAKIRCSALRCKYKSTYILQTCIFMDMAPWMPRKFLSIGLVVPCARKSSSRGWGPSVLLSLSAYSFQASEHVLHGGTNFHLKKGGANTHGVAMELWFGKTQLKMSTHFPKNNFYINPAK